MTVDEFVKTKIDLEYRELAQTIRNFMSQEAPEAKELFTYGLPMWKKNHLFAYISPSKSGLKLSFIFAVHFKEDKLGLLKGNAKHARYLELKTIADFEPKTVKYYLNQALEYDKSYAVHKH